MHSKCFYPSSEECFAFQSPCAELSGLSTRHNASTLNFSIWIALLTKEALLEMPLVTWKVEG